jgi:hypothetical protein
MPGAAPIMNGGLPSSFNPNQFTYNSIGTPGAYNSSISGLPAGWNIQDPSTFAQGMPSFSLIGPDQGNAMTAPSASYSLGPNGMYSLDNYTAAKPSDYGGIADQLIQGASMAGLGLAGGLAGASAAGLTGGATTLFGGANPLFGTAASAPAGTSGGLMQVASDLPASDIGGVSGLGTLPASSTPGAVGLGDTGSMVGTLGQTSAGFPGTSLGAGASLSSGATAPSWFGGADVLGNVGTGLGTAGGSDLSSILGKLFTPGGSGSLLNTLGIGSTLSAILGSNKSGQLGNNLTGPYNTALGNAQPAINNLNSLLSAGPQGFYNTPIGQNLMLTQGRNINAQQSAGGRFGIQFGPNGNGGQTPNVPPNGQGVDALNLLNQYMAQQYNNTVQTAAGAASPLLSAINATYPGYNAGNVIGANSLNPLMSLFNNPAINNAGNSALQYLWNGVG